MPPLILQIKRLQTPDNDNGTNTDSYTDPTTINNDDNVDEAN